MSTRAIAASANSTETQLILQAIKNAGPQHIGIVYQRDVDIFKLLDPDGTLTALRQLLSADSNGDLITGLRSGAFTGIFDASTVAKQTKSANYTMTAADSGYVTQIDTDAVVITLPSTVVGYTYIFQNIAAAGVSGMAISPAAADKFVGVGLSPQDNKDLINTKATSKYGDTLIIVGDGVDGWYVQRLVGTWAREA